MSPKRNAADERKTLTQLEGSDWGVSPSNSYIEQGCHQLRYKPLNEMGVEDLRLLVSQSIGLPYLMPIVFDVLRKNPLAEGMHYPGDLLAATIRADPSFYKKYPAAGVEIQGIAQRAIEALRKDDKDASEYPLEGINEALAIFNFGQGMGAG